MSSPIFTCFIISLFPLRPLAPISFARLWLRTGELHPFNRGGGGPSLAPDPHPSGEKVRKVISGFAKKLGGGGRGHDRHGRPTRTGKEIFIGLTKRIIRGDFEL